jgi:hypothetical protein
MSIEYKGILYATVQEAAMATGDKYTTVYARVKADERKAKQAGRVREVNRLQKSWLIQKQVLDGKYPK